MAHSIKLKFFQDGDSGEWGLAHSNAIDNDTPFNAFWGGQQIFHDCFEHYFENNHKYFTGRYSFNVAGEMVAMGAAMYYYHTLGISNRPLGNYNPFTEDVLGTTFYEIQNAIENGGTMYGDTLESKVPYQSPVEEAEMEWLLEKYQDKLTSLKLPEEEEVKETAQAYKNSVNITKIKNLHRYGYRLAERLIPDNRHNAGAMYDFIEYFNDFCKNNSAEDLANYFSHMIVTLRKVKGEVRWTARLVAHRGGEISDCILREGKSFNIYDNVYSQYSEY